MVSPQVVVDVGHLHDGLPALVQDPDPDGFWFVRQKLPGFDQLLSESPKQEVARVSGVVQVGDDLAKVRHLIWKSVTFESPVTI